MSSLTLKEQLQALSLGSPQESGKKSRNKQAAPSEGAKKKPAWLEQAQYGVELLKAYFPACFKEMKDTQPLKIGIKQDLVKRLATLENVVLTDKACMVSSLSYYVGSPAYHKNVVVGATRIDLDGQPTGTVTAEEAKYSVECRSAKMQKRTKPTTHPKSKERTPE